METEIDQLANPFSDWVFREPRQPGPSVTGLNDPALAKLLAQFKRLHPDAGTAAAASRRTMSEPAQLVVSPQPGYGKSHLIGRLFSALEGRATLIYVTPFQSPSLCWQSILLRTVQELTFPDRVPRDGDPSPGDPPAQLDAFAHGVLAHLVAGLIESGRIEHGEPADAAAWLRSDPLASFGLSNPDHPWSSWLRAVFEHFHHEMEAELRRAGLGMNSPGWLRVLFRYAASLPGDEVRALCLSWMSGQAIEPAEAALLGLRTGEITPAEQPDQINELCWRRLLDFCQLSAYYRPFIFCFDQTEAYGHMPALARCFGTVVAQIHLTAPNQMMVVTANQQPWEETIARYMETADKDRFVPLPLEGINRAQAEELVRLRCQSAEIPPELASAFLHGDWLKGRFPTERNRTGIRQFLQLCTTRWENAGSWWHGFTPAAGAVARPARSSGPSLSDLFDRYSKEILQKPKRLLFNPDALRWLVEEVARDRPGWSVSINSQSARAYLLPIIWTGKGDAGKIFIGFEPGDNWKRWRAILQEARACCLSSASSPPLTRPGVPQAKAVFFRTAEQVPIPGTRWSIREELLEAKESFLDVIELDESSTAELYAARTLYLDSVARDLPFKADEVMDFLLIELDPLWQRIQASLGVASV